MTNYNDLYFEYRKCHKKTTMPDLREFIFKNYYKKKSFTKEDRYYLLKKAKKDLALSANKAKEHYELFFRKEIKKFLKHQKLLKTNNGDIKSVLKPIKQSIIIT